MVHFSFRSFWLFYLESTLFFYTPEVRSNILFMLLFQIFLQLSGAAGEWQCVCDETTHWLTKVFFPCFHYSHIKKRKIRWSSGLGRVELLFCSYLITKVVTYSVRCKLLSHWTSHIFYKQSSTLTSCDFGLTQNKT